MPEIQGYLKRLHACSWLEPARSRWGSNAGQAAPSASQPPPLGAAPAWTGASQASGLHKASELPPGTCHSRAAWAKHWHINQWAERNTQQRREKTEIGDGFWEDWRFWFGSHSVMPWSGLPDLPLITKTWYLIESWRLFNVVCQMQGQYSRKILWGKGRKSLLAFDFWICLPSRKPRF